MLAAMLRVKICCIANHREAELAISLGVSALGLVSEMPSGPGVISETQIARIAATVPPAVATFLLTSKRYVEAIIEQQRRCRVKTLQICDSLPEGSHRRLRQALPGVSLVQVIHVRGPEAIQEARSLVGEVDALLLDSGNPDLTVKELGGTGRTHDWSISRRLVREVQVPVFLAGGLRPENVATAVREVRPYGIDVCSGVRSNRALDAVKLERFIEAARSV